MRVGMSRIDAAVRRQLSEQPDVQKELIDVARSIAKTARKLAPISSRNLRRRGIGVARHRNVDGTLCFIVGWTHHAWYGWMVEAGTSDAVAKPHLVPAAIMHGARGEGY